MGYLVIMGYRRDGVSGGEMISPDPSLLIHGHTEYIHSAYTYYSTLYKNTRVLCTYR